MARVTASNTINAAFAFLPDAWRKAWGALGLYAVVNWLIVGAEQPSVIALLRGSPAQIIGAGLVGLVGLVAVSVMVSGAMMRLGLAQGDPDASRFVLGPAGVQWSRMEWRLLGAGTLFSLMLALILLPLGIILLGLFTVRFGYGAPYPGWSAGMLGFLTGPGAIISVWVIGLITITLATWLGVRFITYMPATADQQRIVLFRSWPYTRGAFWAVFLAYLAIAAAGLGIGLIAGLIDIGVNLAMIAAPIPQAAKLLLPLLVQSISSVILLPASYAVMIHVYRAARPQPTMAAVFD